MAKLKNVQKQLVEHQIDGILITSKYNRKYITGFTGSSGVALITKDNAYFITDFRYVEQAEKEAQQFRIIEHEGSIIEEVANICTKEDIKKLGFEQDYLSYSLWTQYKQSISAELVPISNMIERIRMIKTEEEIAIIKEAANIADAAFKHILDYIQPGVAEIDIANELEFFMRRSGATSSSFDMIVASGWRSALPHGVASEKLIEPGEFVTLDFGALHKGYVSDLTRTVAVGEPSEQLKEIYDVVLQAQLLAMKQIKPGLTGKEADQIARDYISEKGYGQYFGHSLGHGIGLEVHEGPGLSMRSETKLVEGMVVTVEPGIYLTNIGGVRIEDDALVTETGLETMTHSTKELIIL